MRTPLLIAALFSLALISSAQDIPCDDERYASQVFDGVDVSMDVQYGQNTSLAGSSKTLLMDIYEPEGDTAQLRPLIIMAHGGAFVTGDREQTVDFCENMSKRGYVVANINYRLIDQIFTDSLGMFRAVLMAVHDMRAAVRYIKQEVSGENSYRIDSSYIFTAGVSAGGIMASHLGFWDTQDEVPAHLQNILEEQGGFEGQSNDITSFSSKVYGVLNYSGALMRASWIDADDPPVYSAHDDLDPTVPCGYGTSDVVPFPVYVYGSCAMKTVADQVGVPNRLYLVENSDGHVSYVNETGSRNQVYAESASFLKSIMCQTVGTGPAESLSASRIRLYPNPFHNMLNLESDEEILKISIYNMLGQQVGHYAELQGRSIELGHLDTGMYLIRLVTPGGTRSIKAIKK